MSTPIYADNCQACGAEYLSSELIPVKLGEVSLSRIRICLGCLAMDNNVFEDYRHAAELIVQTSQVESALKK